MPAENDTPNVVRNFQEKPSSNVNELLEMGFTEEQLGHAFSENLIGNDAFGEGLFDFQGIKSELGGLALNMLVVQPFVNWLGSTSPVGEIASTAINIVGSKNDSRCFRNGKSAGLSRARCYDVWSTACKTDEAYLRQQLRFGY